MVNLSNLPEITTITDENSLIHLRTSAGRDVSMKFVNLKNATSGGGEWDSTKQYNAGDIVTYQSGVYIARKAPALGVSPDFTINADWLIKYKYEMLASLPIGAIWFVDDYTQAKSPGATLWCGQWASLQSTTYGQVWMNPSVNETTGVDSNVYFYWNPNDLTPYDQYGSLGLFNRRTRVSGDPFASLISSSSVPNNLTALSIPQSFAAFNPGNLNHHLRPRIRTLCGYRLEGYGDLDALVTGGKG